MKTVISQLEVIRSIRKPFPRQTGGPQGTPKGKRGYVRRDAKQRLRKEGY